jgi:hypothetical protein
MRDEDDILTDPEEDPSQEKFHFGQNVHDEDNDFLRLEEEEGDRDEDDEGLDFNHD